MTEPSHWLPLTEENVRKAYDIIKPYIHHTPVLTSKTLNRIASSPQTTTDGQLPAAAQPKINLFFKCENYQRIGAFKVRGAFHAVLRLVQEMGEEDVRKRGLVTHSSGNHAQALALVAQTLNIPAYIVMPTISIPSKIAGTKSYGARVIFSGSTSQEREAIVERVIQETSAILVPPYEHPDVILGQGTAGLELAEQVSELVAKRPELSVHTPHTAARSGGGGGGGGAVLDAVITPLGGGGLTSGTATFFSESPATRVFGAEPSFEGGDDCRRGLAQGKRIETVKTLTIADGLRTPVGVIPWSVISDPRKVNGVYAVTEAQIKDAMRLVLERMKVVIEPSAAVPLAVVLYNEEFRRVVEKEGGEEGWNIGVVFSGGNTTVDVIGKLFADN
ncbi:hypothetical protein AJ80_05738 [Polytolypa hystricis UAMH7299]|uniref:Tryptophan synthase beta chain-like PALP domain-containing protein n=1 Tax=Polytolypa hystricis (strain UAMH7299) TaxID=1447883 RepID=A0A2B7Y1A5_POLH7|nr:hypothetical protein AJ80_05738 [Polytolypa hystricis UAMH7299]